jgi:hypothetical protein
MGASQQYLQYVCSMVPLAAGISSSGGIWGATQGNRKEVEVNDSSGKMLADLLDDSPAVLDAL